MTATIGTLAIVLAACGGGSGSSSSGSSDSGSARSGSLVYGESTAFPENLSPLIAAGNSTAGGNLLIRVLPAVFNIMPDFTVVYDKNVLASDPTNEQVGGKQTITYTLNDKAQWSDGTAMSEKDLEYTWRIQKSLDPADGGCASLLGSTGYDQIESVTAGDTDKTAIVTFATPFPDWKSLFTFFPQHLLDKGDAVANCDAITTGWPVADGLPSDFSGGPWQLKKAGIDASAQVFTLTPNDKWWGDGPKLQRLVYQTIGSEAGTTVSALQGGEVNLVYPQPQLDLVTQIKGLEPNVTSETNFGLTFEHMDLNTLGNVQLAKPEVRKAIALALDRQGIVDGTVGQFDDRAQLLNNRFYVNNQPEYKDNAPPEYNTQDTAGAKAMLEGAGFTLGADGLYADADGPIQIIMSTTQNNPLREATIDLVAAQLGEAGIGITKSLDPDIFAGADKPTSLESKGYQIALFAWVSSPFVSSNASIYKSDGGQNYVGGNDPAVDALLTSLTSETDPAAQADLANQADAALWQDMYTIPLYQKPTFIAFSSNYDGIGDNATLAGPLWNSDTWTQKS